MTETLNIQMFGELRIWRGADAIRLRTSKELALLVYLIAEGGAQSRDALTALLWPDQARDRARNSLRVALAHLREEFSLELQATRTTLAFVPTSGVETDFLKFEQAAERGDFEVARALYQGPFMTDFRLRDAPLFTQWLSLRRQHYSTLIEAAVPRLTRETALPSRAEEPVLVGRALELRALSQAVECHRLVTISGLIGVGKSVLAQALARQWQARAQGPVMVLTPAGQVAADQPSSDQPSSDQCGVSQVDTWRVVGQPAGAGSLLSLNELAGELSGSATLLVLDNADDRLAGDALPDAQVLQTLLGRCAGLKILVTRRRPLCLKAEHVFLLSPLAAPDAEALERSDAQQLQAFPAVSLLADRLQLCRPGQALDLRALGAICAALGGVPLALELIAAQGAALSPAELLGLIAQPFEVLEARHADAPTRHHSLHAAFDIAVNELSAEQRRLLEDLGVFQGSFQIEDAASLLACPAGRLIGDLRALADAGLVQLRRSAVSETRFELPSLTRVYVQLGQGAARAANLRARQTQVTVRRVAELLPSPVPGYTLPAPLLALDGEISVSLDWCAKQATPEADALGLDLATRLAWPWLLRGQAGEGRRWLTRFWPGEAADLNHLFARAVLDMSQPNGNESRLRQLLEQTRFQGDPGGVLYAWLCASVLALVTPANEAAAWLALTETLPDAPPELCAVWWPRVRGVVLARTGQHGPAQVALSRAYQELSPSARAERALLATDLWQVRGEQRSAASLQERLSDLREAGDEAEIAPYLLALASVQLAQGELDEPLRLIEEQCVLWEDLHLLWGVAESLTLFARTVAEHGEDLAAVRLYGAASAICQVSSPLVWPAYSTLEGCLARIRAPLRTGPQQRAWQEGVNLSRGARLALMREVRLRLRRKREADAAM
jgi:DNA-binding SARP family transcriptional activator/predicted ATPase